MANVSVAVPVGDTCGEGLIRSGEDLFWTDIHRFLVHRHRPGTTEVATWQFDEPVVALARTEDPDELVVALASRLIFWRPSTGESRDQGFYLEGYPELRLNDGRAAPDGSFWVGSMFNNVGADGTPGEVAAGRGSLYAVDRSEARVLVEGIGVPNTLCWSPDQSRFYFADSIENDLSVYDWDQRAGALSRRRTLLAGYPRGFPDGSAMDVEGCLWNCRFDGGCVLRITPDGEIDRVIELPASHVTTCAFGGPGNSMLFITTGTGWPNRFERLAGSLFAIEAGITGQPEFTARLL